LLDDREKINKAFLMEWEQPGKNGKANPSDSSKCKMVSIHGPIPKKPRTPRSLARMQSIVLFAKSTGGAHATHNMSDCHKYNKDGKIKKSFGKDQCGSTASDKKTSSAFAQLLVKVAKVEKANEKLKKSLHKHKHNYYRDSDVSNSS
jgi:hypothetical protein